MTTTRKSITINPLEKYFNKITRYHIYVFSVIFLSKLPIFWHILNLLFLSPPMTFYCSPDVTDGIIEESDIKTKNQCPCEEPWWDRSVFDETMQTKFGIYCDNSWMISFSQSMAYGGGLIGCFVFGFLSDRFGRLNMFSLSCLILAVSGCLVSIMPTAAAFTCMRFIEGIAVGGTIVTSFVFCIEYCGVTHRELITALFHIPLNFGHITLPGISYLLRNLDEFQLTISLPIFLFAACKFIMMESPKWLIDNDRVDEVVSVIERLNYSHDRSVIQEDIEKYINNLKQKPTKRKIKFWQIFRHRQLSLNFGCMCVAYFVCGIGYYGVSQFIGEMSGNIHLNVALSGAVLLPGTIVCVFLLGILNRRTILISTMFISGLVMLIVICIPNRWNMVKVCFACICNCFFFMSFIIVYLYSVELFPTSIRNSVVGILAMLSRVGQISNPYINHISQTVAGGIYVVLALFCACVCFLLPETKNTSLPLTLEDAKDISGSDKRSHVVLEDSGAGTSNAG